MSELLHHFVAPPVPCVYLPGKTAALEYKTMLEVSADELSALLARGWRRFGPHYFRPACPVCSACVSLRVSVQKFLSTKSQRRALHKCRHLRLEIGRPRVDQQRISLYHKWHQGREETCHWPANNLTTLEFYEQFCFPHPCAREFAYFDGSRLVGLGFVDETTDALSSVYFMFDPDCKKLSLGTASVLFEVSTARERGLKYLYLGYRVRGCRSSEYKSQFRPHELLVGRPRSNENPVWLPEAAVAE